MAQAKYHVQLHQAILALDPIAYWLLDEKQGTVIRDWSRNGRHGAASSDVSTWPPDAGCGDGRSALQFDGTNDCINIQTASLAASLNGSAGAISLLFRKDGDWTLDGNLRRLFYIAVDADNRFYCQKTANSNQIYMAYEAGNVTEGFTHTVGAANPGWHLLSVGWDKSNDQAYSICDDVLSTSGTLGNWAGNIVQAAIGCYSIVGPVHPWDGLLAHFAIFNYAIPSEDFLELYRFWQGQ
jgi:hypothetical protein